MAHAKRAVNKDLRFDGRILAKLLNIVQRKLSRRYHAFKSDLRQRTRGKRVLSRALRARVQVDSGEQAKELFCKSDIRNDERVRTVRKELLRKQDRGRKLRAVQLRIQNDIGFHSVQTAERNGIFQFLIVKIARVFSGIEALRSEINGVRACGDRRLQSGRRSRGREKFGFHIKNQKIFGEKSRFSAFLIKKIKF